MPYVLTALFVFTAITIQLVLRPYIRATPFLVLFGAVMAASRLGGIGPGLFATVLGAVAANVLFLPPYLQPSLAPPDLLAVAMFSGICVFICLLAEDLRRSHAALARANHELEARVEERTQAVVAANRELETFSYSASHDLRAPVRAIDGYATILEEALGPNPRPEVAHPLARIRAAARRMSLLIDDLLALSRVARVDIQCVRVDVTALAREMLHDLARQNPERQVDLVIDPALEVEADAGLLRIVLDNLLSNAWKFTGRKPGARIEVRRVEEPGYFGFVVADDGAGFEPRYQERLFRPFERLHPGNEFEGSGVGLAIVHRAVERHGGRVVADGAPGRGARFTVLLPARARARGAWEAPPGAEAELM